MSGAEEPPIGDPKPLSPEEKNATADVALDAMNQFLASKLSIGHPSSADLTVKDPAVGGADAHIKTALADTPHNGQGTGTVMKPRRGAGRNTRPATSTGTLVAPVAEGAPTSPTADATVATAVVVDKQQPVIEVGRYRDQDGILCDVREENGMYYYTPLEGDGAGEEIPATTVGDLKELMKLYKWEKVADDTVPTANVLDPARVEAEPSFVAEKGRIYDFQGNRGPLNRLVRTDEGYYFVDFDGKRIGKDDQYSKEEDIKHLAQMEQWQLIAVDSIAVAPKTPDAGIPTSPDAALDAGKEKIKLPEKRERLYYSDADGHVLAVETVKLDGVSQWNYLVVNTEDSRFDLNNPLWLTGVDDLTEDEVLLMAKEQNWKLVDAPLLAPKAADASPVAPPAMPPTPDASVDAGDKRVELLIGLTAIYTTNDPLIPEVKIQRVNDDLYRDLLTMIEYTDREIQSLARAEGWKKRDVPVTPDVSREDGMRGFQLLNDGERAHYFVPEKKSSIMVEKVHGVYIFSPGGNSVLYSEEDIAKLAQTEKWQFFAEGLTPEDFEKNSLSSTKAEMQRELMDGLETEVKEARFDYVTVDFKQKKAFSQITGVLRGLLGKELNDQDTVSAKARYETALMRLQESQLGELKKSGLSDAELHTKMGEMLMYYKNAERVNLFEDRLTVEAENKKFPGKVADFFENIGKAYNTLTPAQKITLAVTVLGASALIGATGGTAGAAMGAGMMGVRRVVASLGAGVGMDILTGQGTEYLRKRSATKEHEEEMKEVQALSTPIFEKEEGILKNDGSIEKEESFEKLKEFLEKDIKALDAKFQSQKREKFWRKTIVWGTALGASSYFTYKSFLGGLSGGAGSPSLEEESRRFNQLTASTGASEVEQGTTASRVFAPGVGSTTSGESVFGGSLNDISSLGLKPVDTLNLSGMTDVRPGSIVTLGGGESVSPSSGSPMSLEHARFLEANGVNPDQPVSVESAARVTTLREDYTVTAADGKKGLWGVIERRLPEGMRPADQNRVIASIENLMRKDLAAMTPAERAAAGFPKGSIDLIYKGGVIQFDKFPSLTPERIQAIMDGQSVGTPSAMPGIPDPVSATERAQILDAFRADAPNLETRIPAPVTSVERAQILDGFRDGPTVDPTRVVQGANVADHDMRIQQLTDPRQFIIDNPGSKELLFRTTARLHSELLMLTPGEDGVPFQYDYAANGEKLGNTQMSQVLKDFGSIRPRNINLNPLHPDQERALANLFRNATKAFGIEAAQPKAGESATYYIGRMATAALRKGVDIKVLLRH